MAWNPNVPTVTNRVQDDLDAIRENFQHLDQLADRVDELQTVSELAPIANDLQTVSGLAPYVQAILDSRIVEMGSNSNGEYVRWENGLQVCWHKLTLRRVSAPALGGDWNVPAPFSGNYAVLPSALFGEAGGNLNVNSYLYCTGPFIRTQVAAVSIRVARHDGGSFDPTDTLPVNLIAIGRWK